MIYYRVFRFYSPELDSEAARISMVDERNREYYRIVPAIGGREWREAREAALDRIEAAILRGDEPGEVA